MLKSEIIKRMRERLKPGPFSSFGPGNEATMSDTDWSLLVCTVKAESITIMLPTCYYIETRVKLPCLYRLNDTGKLCSQEI